MDQDLNRVFEINPSLETLAISNEHLAPEIKRDPVVNIPALSVDGTKPIARILDTVDVHAIPGADSKVISYLEPEDVIELHKLWKKKGGWIEMRMPGGLKGYIPSHTNMESIDRVKLKKKDVGMFNQPSSDGTLIYELTKGTLFWKFENPDKADTLWTEVRLDSGEQGYIPSSTKIKTLAQITYPLVETALHDVMVGAIWCILGIAITAGTYSAASDAGGTYLVCWGAVLFGGLQFLKGLFRAVIAEKPTNYDSQTN